MAQPPGFPPGFPPVPPSSSSGGPGGITPDDEAALKLPTGGQISPNDPMVNFFSQLFPNLNPALVLHYAATFKNTLYQWVENEIKKDQERAHKAAEDAKKRMQGG